MTEKKEKTVRKLKATTEKAIMIFLYDLIDDGWTQTKPIRKDILGIWHATVEKEK